MMENKKFHYDVALSFAGEDRDFVETCAELLRAMGLNVFYDNYEKENLAGKDLYSFLGQIYRDKAQYAVVFVSSAYKTKLWTRHELKFITARSFSQPEEYLIPVRMDSTSLDSIPDTIGYIQGNSPNDVARLIAKKVNPKIDIDLMFEQLKYYLPDYKLSIDGCDVVFECAEENFNARYQLSLMMELYRCDLIFGAFIAPAIVPN